MTPQTTPNDPGNTPDVEALAAEFLIRTEDGEKPSETQYIQDLSDNDRETFLDLIRGVQGAKARMPKRLGEGDVLGGRYKILESLDSGGMGQVFTAMDTELERAVALKVLLPEAVGDPEREELLREESKMLAALQHPGIVGVHDVGRDHDALYVAMDLVDGRDLNSVLTDVRKRLKAASLDGKAHPVKGAILGECIERELPAGHRDLIDPASWYRTAATILVELTHTIEAAHENGVVHRDLKPKNIMLQGGGNPIVLDFGLAGRREVKVGRVTQGFYGSVPYVTPEQASSYKVGSDPRSDIYQLGLVLYEMLTLRRSFPGSSLPSILLQVKEGQFDPPRSVNPNAPMELEAICLKAMERSADARYQAAREMREDLERYLAGLAPNALKGHKLRRVARATRFVMKKRATWLAAAAAVLAVTMAGSLQYLDASRWKAKTAFVALAPGETKPKSIDMGSLVSLNDLLGVHVDTSHDATVYAVSVFGGRTAKQQYVVPTPPQTAETMRDEPNEKAGLRLSAGENLVFCSRVEDKEQVTEGLLVFESEDENPFVEDWIAALGDSYDPKLDDGVPLEQALEMFDDMVSGKTRGGALTLLSDEEREFMIGDLTSADLLSNLELSTPGLRRFYVACQLKRD
jgi:serine/threonine protein kinase